MSDVTGKKEQARTERKKEHAKWRSKINKLMNECLKLQSKGKLHFVECCATCEHQFNGKCEKCCLPYVNSICVCKFWKLKPIGMCSTVGMDSMLFNIAGK